jgi:hypothetical protein
LRVGIPVAGSDDVNEATHADTSIRAPVRDVIRLRRGRSAPYTPWSAGFVLRGPHGCDIAYMLHRVAVPRTHRDRDPPEPPRVWRYDARRQQIRYALRTLARAQNALYEPERIRRVDVLMARYMRGESLEDLGRRYGVSACDVARDLNRRGISVPVPSQNLPTAPSQGLLTEWQLGRFYSRLEAA